MTTDHQQAGERPISETKCISNIPHTMDNVQCDNCIMDAFS